MRTQYEVFLAQLASKDLVTNYSTRDFRDTFRFTSIRRCFCTSQIHLIQNFFFFLLISSTYKFIDITMNITSYKFFFSNFFEYYTLNKITNDIHDSIEIHF